MLSGAVDFTEPNIGSSKSDVDLSGGPARLDISRLGEVVHKLFAGGLAPSTLKSYRSCTNKYAQFCSSGGFSPVPVSEHVACLFMAFLHQERLAGSLAKSYLAALRYTQIAIGLEDPKMAKWPRLSYVTRDSRN